MAKYYVEALKDNEWCPVVNLKTEKVVYKYTENTANKFIQHLENRYKAKFRLKQAKHD